MRERRIGIKLGANSRNQKLGCGRVVPIKVVVEDFIKMAEEVSKNKTLNEDSRAEVAEMLLGKLTVVTGHINHPDEFKSVRSILLDAVNTQPLGIAVLKLTANHYFRNERTKGTFSEFGFDEFGSDVFMNHDTRPIMTSSVIASVLNNLNLKDALDKLNDEQIEIIRELYMPLYQLKISEIDSPRWYNLTRDVLVSSIINFISSQLMAKRTPMSYLINRVELLKTKFNTPMFEDMIKTGELVKLVSEKLKELYFNIDALEIAKATDDQKDLYATSVELAKDLIGDVSKVGGRITKCCEKLLELKEDLEAIGYVDRERTNVKVEQYGIVSVFADLTDKVKSPWSALIIFNFIINIIVEIYVTKSTIEDFKDLLMLDDNR